MVEIVKYKIWVGMLLRWRNTGTLDIVRVSRINSKMVYLYNYKKECDEYVSIGVLYQNLAPHWLQEKDIIEFRHEKTQVNHTTPTSYKVEYVFIEYSSMTYYYKVKSLLTNVYHKFSDARIIDMVELVSTET